MKNKLFFIFLSFQAISWGAACCGGGGPKSFLSLQELQNFDLAVLSSFQESYGWYNSSGEAFSKKGPVDYTIQISSVGRLAPNWEAFARVPMVYRVTDYGSTRQARSSLGDVSLGLRWTFLRSLFVEDPFPTVSLVMGGKIPSGLTEINDQGRMKPGTGNGLWEPLIGLSFRKDYYGWLGNIDFTFVTPYGNLKGRSVRENQINLTESLSYAFNRQFNLGGGSTQSWTFDKEINGQDLSDAAGRSLSVFTAANYFLTQFTSVGAAFEWIVPADGFGVNQPINRTLSFNVRYGFY
jgi:hypothetical protein